MPYRAPELFDVKTGKTLDEKVDIWVSHHPLRLNSDVETMEAIYEGEAEELIL